MRVAFGVVSVLKEGKGHDQVMGLISEYFVSWIEVGSIPPHAVHGGTILV